MTFLIQSNIYPISVPPNADSAGETQNSLFYEDTPLRSFRAAQFGQTWSAKTAPPPCQVQDLKQAGLSRCVAADDEVQPCMGPDLKGPVQANVFAPQEGDRHFRAASA